MNEYFCEYCKQTLILKNGRSFGAHKTNCNLNPNRQQIIKKIVDATTLERIIITKHCVKCNKKFSIERRIKQNGMQHIDTKEKQFCSRACANSHIISDETKAKISLNANPHNKGKGKKFFCVECGAEISLKSKSKLCQRCYKASGKHSELMKGKTGGFRKTGGRGKYGTYKGYFCQSSWELAYVIYNLEHNIKFVRNQKSFEYLFENKKHKYYPDFILENGTYIEIKGYYSEQWEAKQNQFKEKLIILDKNSIKLYMQYAEEKYGKDFIKLYESIV